MFAAPQHDMHSEIHLLQMNITSNVHVPVPWVVRQDTGGSSKQGASTSRGAMTQFPIGP